MTTGSATLSYGHYSGGEWVFWITLRAKSAVRPRLEIKKAMRYGVSRFKDTKLDGEYYIKENDSILTRVEREDDPLSKIRARAINIAQQSDLELVDKIDRDWKSIYRDKDKPPKPIRAT